MGQGRAKRAVAIALRNRMRRRKLPPEIAEEVLPKNILMIGPTGVGKTEIARRLARLAGSPFIKVEASKFTEVGYVGRDVESMVRDLVEVGIDMVRQERREQVRSQARQAAERRLLDLLLPPRPRSPRRRRDLCRGRGNARSRPPGSAAARRCGCGWRPASWRIASSSCRPPALPAPGMRIFGAGGMEELDMNLQGDAAQPVPGQAAPAEDEGRRGPRGRCSARRRRS